MPQCGDGQEATDVAHHRYAAGIIQPATSTPFGPDEPGWQILPELHVEDSDVLLGKPASDAFQATDLAKLLGPPDHVRLIITGCDTEFCIDSTVRSALARDYSVVVPSDGHSLPDRRHLAAPKIIEHHHAIWSTPGALAGRVIVCPSSEVRLS